MKRIKLLTSILILSGAMAYANQVNARVLTVNDGLTMRYHNAQPVMFIERGVKFFVFPNGEFEYTRLRSRHNRRGSANLVLRNPNRRIARNAQSSFRRAQIRFDQFGRISSVGNVPVRYDQLGRVFRIGSVFMNYGRRGLLNQVGNLNVRYSRNGVLLNRYGNVHRGNYNRGFAFRGRNLN
jgi:hypothetical protein